MLQCLAFCPSSELCKTMVMSYNLFGWNALHNPEKTENIYETIRAFNPDILGVQEDEGMNIQIAENIGYGNDYR